MLKSPVLSTPVQRALAGAAATGGAVQASLGFWPHPSEGADQSRITSTSMYPSEGADQSRITSTSMYPSEGADQSRITSTSMYPSEGADQSSYGFSWAPSEG
jgi:hypothetical protein